MIKAMIFDLDGTLLDSMRVWNELGIEILSEYGKTTDEDLDYCFRNMSIDEAIDYLHDNYLLTVSKLDIRDTLKEIIYKRYQQSLQLKEGVKSYIQFLYQKKIKLYILTASDKSCAIEALKNNNLDSYFDLVITCDEIGYSKNNLKLFELVVEKLNLCKNEVIVVEDALHAIKAAKKVGLTTWAVYEETQKEDWKEIMLISDKYFQSMIEMEDYDV